MAKPVALMINNPHGRTIDRPYLRSGPELWHARAAVGPDYGIGNPSIAPQWTPGNRESGRVLMVASNRGLDGGSVAYNWWINQRVLSRPLFPVPSGPGGPANVPTWNNLIPPNDFNLRVLSAKQFAAYQAGHKNVSTPLPVAFTGPGPATLYK